MRPVGLWREVLQVQLSGAARRGGLYGEGAAGADPRCAGGLKGSQSRGPSHCQSSGSVQSLRCRVRAVFPTAPLKRVVRALPIAGGQSGAGDARS